MHAKTLLDQKPWRYLGVAFTASAMATLPLAAQESEEDVINLTPFEVSAEEDVGYLATSTLAGTRMRMSLDDVGSAVSVITEELMADLGATDNETLLAYGLGTEVGGVRGNFINPNTEGLENDNLVNPQGNNRIRGLTSADSTRNYFKSDVPWDGYNTNRIDIQRGPNSVLFGLGSPAGIINNSTRVAGFRNDNKVQVRFDGEGSIRASGNFNRVLLEDSLAVRVDLLMDRQEYQQQPAFEDDDRFHGGITWQPGSLNNENMTTRITASVEKGNILGNRPRTVVPIDAISTYYIPTNSNGFGPGFENGSELGPNSDIFGGGGQTYSTIFDSEALEDIPWLSSPSNANAYPIFDFQGSSPDFTLSENGMNARGGYLVFAGDPIQATDEDGDPIFDEEGDPVYEEDPQRPGENLLEYGVVSNDGAYVHPFTGDYVYGVEQNLRSHRPISSQGMRRVADDNALAFAGFWRDGAIDQDQFDFMNNLIDGANKLESTDFTVYDVTLRNTFWNNRVGYQLGFFKQDALFRQDSNLGNIYAPTISVEANAHDVLSQNLTSPGSNPNAGRAFVEFELRLRGGREDIRNREAMQAQVFASFEGTDLSREDNFLTYLIGKNDFSGLFKNRQLESTRREFWGIGVDEDSMRNFAVRQPSDPSDPDFDPSQTDPGPGARMTRLTQAFGYTSPRIRVYFDSTGPNNTGLQPFSNPVVPSGKYPLTGFVATPNFPDGVNPEDPWTSPDGDELYQAQNPANYTGTVQSRGQYGIVHATDSPEALEYLTARRFVDREEVDTRAFVWTGGFLNRAFVGMYGVRQDKVKQWSLEHDFARIEEENEIGRTGGPDFDPNSRFLRYSAGTFDSKNWSVKFSPTTLAKDLLKTDLDWMPFNISLLYSEGEVQNPQPGRRDVLLNDLAPATGNTIDRTIIISTKDNRFSLRATSYETSQIGAEAGSVAASDNWRIEQVLREGIRNGVVRFEQGLSGWDTAVLDNGDGVDDPGELSEGRSAEIRAAGFNDVQSWGQAASSAFRNMQETLFSQWPSTQSWITGGEIGSDHINVNFPDDTVFTEDNKSSGVEFEFTARPTDNWNILVNVSQTEVLRSKVFQDDVNEVLDFIVAELNGIAGDVPLWGPGGQMGRVRVAPFLGQLITNRALLGTPTGEIREWKWNVVTNYDFDEGFLDGFGIGGAVRWEDSQVIGFPPIYVDPQTGAPVERSNTAALSVDLDSPIRDESRTTYDLWLKYKLKVFDNIDWRLQLNIYNLFDDKGTTPLHINPDGSYGTEGIRFGRSWQISSTFEF